MAAESPGLPRDRSPAGNRPAASTTASVLTALRRVERQRGRLWLDLLLSLSVARLRRAVFSSGAASVGRGFRDEPPGAAGAGRGRRGVSGSWNVLTPRAPRPSKRCASCRRLRRAPAPKGRHTRTLLTATSIHLPAAPPAPSPSPAPSSDSFFPFFPSAALSPLLGCGGSPGSRGVGYEPALPSLNFLVGELGEDPPAAAPPGWG